MTPTAMNGLGWLVSRAARPLEKAQRDAYGGVGVRVRVLLRRAYETDVLLEPSCLTSKAMAASELAIAACANASPPPASL